MPNTNIEPVAIVLNNTPLTGGYKPRSFKATLGFPKNKTNTARNGNQIINYTSSDSTTAIGKVTFAVYPRQADNDEDIVREIRNLINNTNNNTLTILRGNGATLSYIGMALVNGDEVEIPDDPEGEITLMFEGNPPNIS